MTPKALVAEVVTHLITPCMRAVLEDLLAKSRLTESYTAHEVFQLLRRDYREGFAKEVLRRVLPIVARLPQAKRQAFYRRALRSCIKDGLRQFSGVRLRQRK